MGICSIEGLLTVFMGEEVGSELSDSLNVSRSFYHYWLPTQKARPNSALNTNDKAEEKSKECREI